MSQVAFLLRAVLLEHTRRQPKYMLTRGMKPVVERSYQLQQHNINRLVASVNEICDQQQNKKHMHKCRDAKSCMEGCGTKNRSSS